MSENKVDLKKLTELVRIIAIRSGDFIEVDLKDLLQQWREEFPDNRLKKRDLANQLRAEFSAENAGGQKVRIPETKLEQRKQTDQQKNLASSDGPKGKKTKEDEQKINVSLEIFERLLSHLQSEGDRQKDVSIEYDKIHELWQSSNSGKSFKSLRIGSFKSFLLNVCGLRKDLSSNDCFVLNWEEIANKISNLKGEEATHQEEESKERQELVRGGEDDTDSESREPNSTADFQVLSAQNAANTRQVINDKSQHKLEKQYFNQMVAILYECGLARLREIFLEIHPGWKNSPGDVQNMVKGHFKSIFKKQKEIFESGVIDKWDVTLICNVLLHTKICEDKLKNDAKYRGYKKAVSTFLNIKNDCYSHAKANSMQKLEFDEILQEMKTALLSIGVEEEDFDRVLKDSEDPHYAEPYLQMLREEMERISSRQDEQEGKIENVDKRLKLVEEVIHGKVKQSDIPEEARKVDPAEWDEWIKVHSFLKKFDTGKSQYILITDRILHAAEEWDNLPVLGRFKWNVVFDLDPDSDINGLLECSSPENKGDSIVVPVSLGNLPSDVDCKRMQWVFANGKNQSSETDLPMETFKSWKDCFNISIQDLIRTFCEHLDNKKPTCCVILSIRAGVSQAIANYIAKKIYQRFVHCKYDLVFACFDPEVNLKKIKGSSQINTLYSNLSLKFFLLGLNHVLGGSTNSYMVPSRQQGLRVSIPVRKYNYMNEYFDILYEGCDSIPTELTDDEQEDFENEHLKSFLKGNPITFESLHFSHDARRSLTTKIVSHISSMPHKFISSQIVEIAHAPGTGATTIARRVLWDLKDAFPCMILKEKFARENTQDSDTEPYVVGLLERVGYLEKLCELSPIVLIDGSPRMVNLISDQLVRRLVADGRRAIILRCVDFEGKNALQNAFIHEASKFEVKSVLKDDKEDLNEFRTKFNDYCKRFDNDMNDESMKNKLKAGTRVFHFPMLAMLEKFDKLKEIVTESLEKLKAYHPSDFEVAVLVAYIQLYASSPTPATLLEKYFKKGHQTYNEMCKGYSEYLLNLMVMETARSKAKFIAQKPKCDWYDGGDGDQKDDEDRPYVESYTFQHQKVAELVWEKSERHLNEVTEEFVKSPVVKDYKKNKYIQRLTDDLFLYNAVYAKDEKDDSKFRLPVNEHRFSFLITKLATNASCGRIFEEAARTINDVTYYSHVARFFVFGQKKEQDFEKAYQLIKEGLIVGKDGPKKKIRDLKNTEGYIRLREMKQDKKINVEDDLKKKADEALTLFHHAMDNPPRQFPNPLLGRASVWLFCIDVIIKWKDGNVEEALTYIFQDEFFRSAVGDCFNLLDEVETIVNNNPKLVDPDYTMQLCNDKRIDLMKIVGRRKIYRGGSPTFQSIDILNVCEEISKKYFKTASEKEILRLRAIWLMKQANRLHLLSENYQDILYPLLERLVSHYKMFEYTRNLLDLAAMMKSPVLDTNECFDIIKQWQSEREYDAFSYLYGYALSFVCVANGDISENRARFEMAKKKSYDLTKWIPMRHARLYYMAKSDHQGIRQLITHDELVQKAHPSSDSTSNEKMELNQSFWKQRANMFLHECSGRIRIGGTPSKKEPDHPYIALEQGYLRINVHPNVIGTPFKDYRPDSKVKFYICFCLAGPKALEVRLVDEEHRSKPGYNRQSSARKDGRK